MPFNISGLASGLDVDSLITGLVGAANQPIRDLEAQQRNVQSASQTLTTFSSKLGALKTAATALGSTSSVVWTTAVSSDTSVAATTSGGALPGTYSVEVTSLATRQKSRSSMFAASDTPLGQAGTIDLTYGAGAPVSIAVAATDTLTQVATKINASGARVSASIVSDSGQFRLVVQGLDTGAANTFTMSETGTTLGLTTPASKYQDAADAVLKVDGQPQTSSTNTVTAIGGVTLALVRPTTGAVTVTVQTDGSAIKTKLQAFATAYNDIVNTGHSAAGFAGIKPTNAILAGDTAIRGTISHLRSVLNTPVAGLTGRYRSALDIGFKPNADGTLTFDSAAFDAALTKDPIAVQTILAGVGTQKGAMQKMADEADTLANREGGLVKARVTSLGSRLRRMDDLRLKLEAQVASYETNLRKQFTAMDDVVSRYKAMGNAISGIGGGSSNTNE